MSTLTERLVTRLAAIGNRKQATRRGFLATATLTGTALAVNPWSYLTKPQSAYASVCGPGANCGDGWSAMCCSINNGSNTCPPNTYPGGWWKADRSSFCGGAARYYIDCNAKPGYHFTCHCNYSNCDHRYVACNIFRYGQCNTQVAGVTAVVCRQISCRPPWQLYPGHCGTSSATDNNTALHNAPCLTKANTYPALVTFPYGPSEIVAGHFINAGQRMTSNDRHTTLIMNDVGNLKLINQDGTVWSTHTEGHPGARAVLRPDGDFRVIDRYGKVIWSSHSSTPGGPARLQLRDTGKLTVVHGAHIVWQSPTHTP